MKKAIAIVIILVVVNIYTTITMSLMTDDNVKTTKKEHQRLHNLIKDSVIMHNYFEAHYEGGYFEPCEVVVECEKIEL